MTLPAPKTWSAGLWSAAEMNIEMRDVLRYFLSPPMCIVRKDGNPQAAQANTTITVEWDTVVYDNDGMFGVDASRFTCKTPGYYMVSWQIQLFTGAVSGSGSRSIVLRQFNASGTQTDQVVVLNTQATISNESYAGSVVVGLNASDYIAFSCFHFDSANHQIIGYEPSQSQYGCQVSMRWLSTL